MLFSPASLQRHLAGMGSQSLPLLHLALHLVVTHGEKAVSIDDLLRTLGSAPKGLEHRRELRGQVWNWLIFFDSCQVIGVRPRDYFDTGNKMLDLTSRDALFRIKGTHYAADAEPGAPPLKITLEAGPWLDQFRFNHKVLSYTGDCQRLARIPTGQPSGSWAQGIGMALQQRWREQASHKAQPFTRRSLFSLFHVEPDVATLLASHTPSRAMEYWDKAIRLLCDYEVVGDYQPVKPLPEGRQGWITAWWEQPLNIRPTTSITNAQIEIASNAVRHQGKHSRRSSSGRGS